MKVTLLNYNDVKKELMNRLHFKRCSKTVRRLMDFLECEVEEFEFLDSLEGLKFKKYKKFKGFYIGYNERGFNTNVLE